jgi:signal transduction histidine kinase
MPAAAAMMVRAAVAALLCAQILVAALRAPAAPRRAEAIWFVVFLGGMLGVALAPAAGPGGLLATSLLLWVAGAYLTARDGERVPLRWHVAAALATGMVLACLLIGWWGTLHWLAPMACTAALVVYPWRRLCGPRHLRKGAADRYLCSAGLLPVAGTLADQLTQLLDGPALSLAVAGVGLLTVGSGYFLTQLNYLRGAPAGAGLAGPTRRLQRLRRRLEAAEESLLLQNRIETVGYLTAGVAHEFKNILSHISATAEWGLAATARGDATRALRLIHGHVGAGVVGVNEMLATVLRGGPEPRSEVPVREELRQMLGIVSASFQAEQVTVDLQVPASLTVVTRKRELLLALLNLVQNGAQIIAERLPHGGSVTVAGRATPGQCILEVTDAAGGVEPEAAGRLFEWGYTTGSGTGLGLHLARRLVERSGGTLTYHPLPGGSCFRITLPQEAA